MAHHIYSPCGRYRHGADGILFSWREATLSCGYRKEPSITNRYRFMGFFGYVFRRPTRKPLRFLFEVSQIETLFAVRVSNLQTNRHQPEVAQQTIQECLQAINGVRKDTTYSQRVSFLAVQKAVFIYIQNSVFRTHGLVYRSSQRNHFRPPHEFL